jgi:hypothetical protein
MSSEFKNPEGLLPYGSIKYEQKVKDAKVKLEEAESILCKFIKENEEFKDYKKLYFIYKNAYVFKFGQIRRIMSVKSNTKGIDGIYIDINTGKLQIVKKNRNSNKVFFGLEKEKNSNDIFSNIDFKHYTVKCN